MGIGQRGHGMPAQFQMQARLISQMFNPHNRGFAPRSLPDMLRSQANLNRPLRMLSGPGVVLYVLAVTVAAWDWGMSLDPAWFSSMYGPLFMISQGLTTFGFAIVVAKQLYGGLGMNPFNPAMIGYVLLLISFPVAMTQWVAPGDAPAPADSLALFLGQTPADAFTGATPLDTFRTWAGDAEALEWGFWALPQAPARGARSTMRTPPAIRSGHSHDGAEVESPLRVRMDWAFEPQRALRLC